MSDAAPPRGFTEADRRAGFVSSVMAYVLWGFLPLFIHILAFADVREVLGQRILWSVPAALVAIVCMSGVRRGLLEIRAAFQPRMLLTLAASAIFIFMNWALYVWLVLHHRVIEGSLAYFLSPLVAIAVGTIFFGEKISAPQIAALGLATAGVVTQGIAIGAPPWMALGICATWSIYMVIRKQAPVPAATGLLMETLLLAPLAMVLLLWAAHDAPLAFTANSNHALLLMLTGPVTALPLILFAFGARRVSYTAVGLVQFLAPTLQFFTGLALGEEFTPLRGVSFALIWAGLLFFAWDSLRPRAVAPA